MNDCAIPQLGNYRILQPLGRGGFACVYLAEHIYLKSLAAIKVLQIELGGDQYEPFLHEARTLAQLIHPHIIRILEFGVEGNTPYLVMDYAPNGSLRQYHTKGTQLPLETVISYVRQVASALEYAHSQHFIHRDVKPGNMLLGKDNEVLLSDFGLALVAHSSASQPTEENVTGTVAYMAPEQIYGKPRPASDQYALAAVVYEWLCGELPFHGSFAEIVGGHLAAPPPPLSEHCTSIPTAVEEVIGIALAKDPEQRFASIEAFAHALEQAAQPVERVEKPQPVLLHPQSLPIVSAPEPPPQEG